MSVLNLRPANLSDMWFLFDLRNHPAVRKYSNNTDEIDPKNHQKWFEAVLLDRSKQIFIADRGGQLVGMVRFEKVDNTYLMSWAVSPEVHGQGMGKDMLKNAVELMAGCQLAAEIKEDNLASIKIAEFVGMMRVKKIKDTLLYQK